MGRIRKGDAGRVTKHLKALDLDTASNIELLDNFEQTINTCRRMWEIHMHMMYGTYTAYILFENMCRDNRRNRRHLAQFHNLITGFDNKVFQVDREALGVFQKGAEEGLAELPGELQRPLK